MAKLLAQIDVGEDIDHTPTGKIGGKGEVVLPSLGDPTSIELVGHRAAVDRPAPDPVDRPDQKIERIRG